VLELRGRQAKAAASLLAASALAAWWWWSRPAGAPPNILLITIDTLRADRVGAYGAQDVGTPWLDRIAREGLRFDAAYATVPLTLPSHVSMLSGLLPAAHTVRTNDGFRVPDGVPLVAEALRGTGYDTAAIVGAYVVRAGTGLGRGFNHYDDAVGPGGERRGSEVSALARAWLAKPRSRPWFLWLHFFDPHLQYDPPEPYRSRYAGRPYEGEIAFTDAQVGELMTFLESGRLLNRTAMIVAADHGESLGDHEEQSHGALLYDGAVRVPMLVRLPAAADAGRTIAEPVSAVEVAATIRDLAGLSAGRPEGLRARLDPQSPAPPPALSETLYLKMLLGWAPLYSLRDDRYKVIDGPEPELYDLRADPLERQNLAASDGARAERLIAVLRREVSRASQAVAPAARADDPEARRVLASLGYIGTPGSLPPLETPARSTPKNRLALWGRIERALALSHRAEHVKAAAIFEDVLREDPDNVLALKFLGARALEVGDLARAVTLNERVVASGLHVADALSNLALAFDRLGRKTEALDAAAKAIAIAPDHAAARYNRAAVLAGMGRVAEAQQDLAHVIKIEPNHPGAKALEARLRAAPVPTDLASAARSLEAAIAADPKNPELYIQLGIVRARAGDMLEAQGAFEQALALNPQATDALERLGALLHRMGKRREARARFEAVLAREAARRAPKLSLAILDLEDGRPRQAIERLEKIAEGWEGAHQAQYYLGEARLAVGDAAGARRAYESAVRLAPAGDPIRELAAARLKDTS
jgi:arylsulfatase A-like enzyme/Tfp pilus assembly protein PilF